jgi:hypothetical protein
VRRLVMALALQPVPQRRPLLSRRHRLRACLAEACWPQIVWVRLQTAEAQHHIRGRICSGPDCLSCTWYR